MDVVFAHRLADLFPDKWKSWEERYNVTRLSDDPLIFYIDDFLTPDQCEAIKRAGMPHLERSTGGLERSISSYRTSSTAWVNTESVQDPVLRELLLDVEDNIAEIIGFPVENQVCACAFKLVRACVCVCVCARVCMCV